MRMTTRPPTSVGTRGSLSPRTPPSEHTSPRSPRETLTGEGKQSGTMWLQPATPAVCLTWTAAALCVWLVGWIGKWRTLTVYWCGR
ncbi:hypothetical protein E2C01_090149 [Portunus trituberculatus]|uniref:Uncharacterized protein n=1 Tax=Portunus trituberculatus TaxID=210409 RepID=A0A5B7JPB5_PORTR|nr:hypothetical protein [Portunus trituberculatus]